ncbi:MAG: glycosyltransferase 87 family protein [Gaiellaceae bacterium]
MSERPSWHAWYLVFVAAIATAVVLIGLKDEAVGFDLATVYVPAAEDVLDGRSPFPSADDPVFQGHQAYVYPPLTAFLSLPLTLLSSPVLEYVGVLIALAIMLFALWLVGVRDPRCYAVFVLWPPTMTAWQNANVSALLLLTCALCWRYRDSWAKEGAALGLSVAFKLVLWPLGLWLLATRRARAAVTSAAVATVAILGSWAIIGFKGFLSYPDLLRVLTDVEGENSHSVSLYSAVLALGSPSFLAHAVSVIVGLVLAAGVVVYGRRGDDPATFLLALLAALAFTPVVWLHYLTLLAVPLAIFRPRLTALWLTPLLFWVIALPGWPVEPRRWVAAVVVGVIAGRLLTRPADGADSAKSPVELPRPLPEAAR